MKRGLLKKQEVEWNRSRFMNKVIPFILLAPVVIYMMVMLFIPFVYGVGISFTNKIIGGKAGYIALNNYARLFQNREYIQSIRNTFVYTIVCVIIKVVFGMVIALLLNTKIKFRNLSRGLILIPWAVPNIVSIITWRWMYSDVGGVLNTIFRNAGLVEKNILWLSTPLMAMFSLVIINVWRGSPFVGTSVLAGLQTIPEEMYEAATVDGANRWQQFQHITLPSVWDLILVTTLITTIWTFNDFETIWLLTKGGPVNSTQVISTFSYTAAIQRMRLGYAQAAAILFMPLMILLVNRVATKTLGLKGEP
jgi:multiple sugar transport system permease protein